MRSAGTWIELNMFARRIRVLFGQDEAALQPCPVKWLDNFSMRNFTNDAIFDDTLPIEDGLLEAGVRVPLGRLHDAMEDWFRRKSYLNKEQTLVLHEDAQSPKG